MDFRLNPATVATLDELAAREDETRTDVVERLIWEEWERANERHSKA